MTSTNIWVHRKKYSLKRITDPTKTSTESGTNIDTTKGESHITIGIEAQRSNPLTHQPSPALNTPPPLIVHGNDHQITEIPSSEKHFLPHSKHSLSNSSTLLETIKEIIETETCKPTTSTFHFQDTEKAAAHNSKILRVHVWSSCVFT